MRSTAGEYAGEVLLARLAVGPLDPGKASLLLGAGQPGPRTDVDLAQALVGDHRHVVRRGHDLGRLVGSPEVARIDGVERRLPQLVARARAPVRVRCR